MVMRLGGLATGIDTDTIVKQMLMREQAKIDKVTSQKQVLQWQQETYRDFAASIKGFKTKYFDVLNKANYALSNDFFTSMKANIAGNDKGLLDIRVGNAAKPGRYEVEIESQAKGAILQTNDTVKLSGSTDLTGKSITIKAGNMKDAITIDDATNIKDLVSKINSNSALKGKVTASFSEISGRFTLETVGTGLSKSLEISGSINDDVLKIPIPVNSIVGAELVDTKNQNITSGVIKLEGKDEIAKGTTTLGELGITNGTITVNGEDITLDSSDTIAKLVEDIKTKTGANVGFQSGKISITAKDNTPFEIKGSTDSLLKLGFISNDTDVVPVKSKEIITSVDYQIEKPADGDVFINGRKVSIEPDNTIKDENGNVIEGIKLIEKDGKFIFTSKNEFNISGAKVTSSSVTAGGQDAKIKVTLPDGTSGEVTNSKNDFTIDGINFTVKGKTDGEKIVFNIDSNVDKAFENVKGLVNAYNELIDSIGSKIYEKKQYKYAPLTEEQKKDMKEEDIKRWEEKAKQGIVRNDDSLSKFLTDLRGSLFVGVEGVNISLKDIGIDTSSDYSQRGKLVVDDEKLRKALSEKPDEVAQLFIKDNPKEPYNVDKGYSGNDNRRKSVGIFQRMSDIIDDAIRTTRNTNGKKGSLLEKAGIKGDTTDSKNTITDKIKEKDDMLHNLARKMQERESRLYKQFAYLEKMTNSYNSQSSWLTQQLGGM